MVARFAFLLGLLLAQVAYAQNPTGSFGPGTSSGGGSSALSPGGTSGQIQYNNSGAFGGYTQAGDCTTDTSTGLISCLTLNSVTPGSLYPLNLGALFSSSGGDLVPLVPTDDCTSGTCAASGSAAISSADSGYLVLLGAHTYTLAQAGTGAFTTGWAPAALQCIAGPCVVTTTTSTFAPAVSGSTLTLQTGDLAFLRSDGTNYQTSAAHGAVPVGVASGGTGLSSGTSGGVLAYTGSGTMASSGTLTANLPVIGGGAGAAPGVGTRSGNTTAFVTTTGTQTSGDCVKIDANGNHVANGSACGGAGSGSVSAVSTSELDSTSDIVLSDVPGLSVTLASSSKYDCVARLLVQAPASGGVSVAFATPDTLTVNSIGYSMGGSAVNPGLATALGTGVGTAAAQGATNGTLITVGGGVDVNAGGTLRVQAAQNASNVTATKVFVNSTLTCAKL